MRMHRRITAHFITAWMVIKVAGMAVITRITDHVCSWNSHWSPHPPVPVPVGAMQSVEGMKSHGLIYRGTECVGVTQL